MSVLVRSSVSALRVEVAQKKTKANVEAEQRQNAYVQRLRGLFYLQTLRLESIFACK